MIRNDFEGSMFKQYAKGVYYNMIRYSILSFQTNFVE